MAAYTRTELSEVVKAKLDLPSAAAAERTTKAVFEALGEMLERGITDKNFELSIHGFGKFKAVSVAAKAARNPSNGEKLMLPARKKIKFSFTKSLADLGK